MPLIEVANTDRVISITSGGAWVPGNPSYTEHPSVPVKANSKPILLSRISWIMAGCVFVGNNFVSGSTSTPIDSTATKTKETNIGMGWNGYPIRKGDKGKCMGIFTKAVAPFTVTNCTCDFEVTDAGQTKVRCQ